MNISIIGGDLRIAKLCKLYAKKCKVYAYGFEQYFCKKEIDNNIIICKNMEDAILNSKYIISGIPLSKDGKNINAPFANNEIKIAELKDKIGKDKTFIAGKIPTEFYDEKISNIDLLKNEEFNILNSIPTAEGCIKIILDKREETIHESNILICGFGRIGKILCNRLNAFGAKIYCAARNKSDFAWIRANGCIPVEYTEIKNIGNKLDILINTVPSLVIKAEALDSFDKDILIIDLASNPGGIDKVYTKDLNLDVITALGIPGKEMPQAAARYIKEIIDELIRC